MVFVDGSYVFHASRRYKQGWRIDYHRLVRILTGSERTLVRVYFYTSISVPPSPSQVKFHQALGYLGFQVVAKPLKKSGERWVERGVEVALATDLLGFAIRNAYDTAILISGDLDYLPAVEEVKRLGKRVEIAGFSGDVGAEMKSIGDRFIGLEILADKITLSADASTESDNESGPST